MRLVHLYRSKQSAHNHTDWDITAIPDARIDSLGMPSQGFTWLWQQLLDEGIIDDVVILYNHGHANPGTIEYGKRMRLHVFPYVGDVVDFYEKGDVIFARSWCRQWKIHLAPKLKDKRVFWYPAGAPVHKQRGDSLLAWKDILSGILVDCPEAVRSSFFNGTPTIPFLKPIHPEHFKPMKMKREYDVCIGGSEATRKKGQPDGVRAIAEYYRLYGKKLHCVVPGKMYPRERDCEILAAEYRNKYGLEIDVVGQIPHKDMCTLYNKSRLFLHLGNNGGNDRSVLEAMACGTPVIMREDTIGYHAEFTVVPEAEVGLVSDKSDYAQTAHAIHEHLPLSDEARRTRISTYFWNVNNREAVLKPWRKLFKETPQ